MTTTYQRALHIFRRDLRLIDNTALNAALTSAKEVVPCFIFNDAQINPHPHRSANGLAFMIESLEELSEEIRSTGGDLLLVRCSGESNAYCDTVSRLIKDLKIDAVFFNMDYTPFSRKRDKAVFDACTKLNIHCAHYSDALLVEPSEFSKDDGKPYTVYTPFFKKASKLSVPLPTKRATGSLIKAQLNTPQVNLRDLFPNNTAPQRISHGGRKNALAILRTLGNFIKYDEERNLPAVHGTTQLAPHNKFGTVSIREVYHSISGALGVNHTLIRELYWRDFFTHIAWHFPHVFGHAFHSRYDAIKWIEDQELLKAWCEGRTGFPIVDAGMRELVATGFMHNRVRMIVASFLVKDLHISWQHGEQLFAQHLTDYDPAVNNGSWQWAASTGCDAQPYFRIFNPWLQQKRFDPECEYIKRWVPELRHLSAKQIHTLDQDERPNISNYPRPIVEHAVRKIYAEEMFRVAGAN
jgi:deoxyribodipyrimidine photo-lyase